MIESELVKCRRCGACGLPERIATDHFCDYFFWRKGIFSPVADLTTQTAVDRCSTEEGDRS